MNPTAQGVGAVLALVGGIVFGSVSVVSIVVLDDEYPIAAILLTLALAAAAVVGGLVLMGRT